VTIFARHLPDWAVPGNPDPSGKDPGTTQAEVSLIRVLSAEPPDGGILKLDDVAINCEAVRLSRRACVQGEHLCGVHGRSVETARKADPFKEEIRNGSDF
jgi:hypothetical protein